MRGTPLLMAVAVLGMVAVMWQASGIAAVVGPSGADDLASGDAVEKQANNSSINEGFSGDSLGANEGRLIGLIISGGKALFDLFKLVLLLPFELNRMGLWWWAAYPIGFLTQIVGSIALLQFWTGRVLR